MFRRLTVAKRYASDLFELETGGPRLLPMEGLRGMSAALVFFVHFDAFFGSYSAGAMRQVFLFLSALGNCGVDVFFALSGYIIYGMLLKKPVPYLRFVQRRIVRLYPVFTAVFLFYVCASVAMPAHSKFHFSQLSPAGYLLANFFMLPGILPIVPLITPAWSLSYELSFYLTLPLLIRWLRIPAWPRPARIAFFITLAAGCLWPSVPTLGRHPRLSMFACGILLNETSGWRFRRWPHAGAAVAVGLFAFALGLFGLSTSTSWTSYCGPVVQTNWFPITVLFVATYALVHFSLATEGFLSRWFQWDWIRWFGNISYSYYLVHGLLLQFILALVQRLPVPKTWPAAICLAFLGASFAVTAVGSAAVFLAIEKPFSLRRQSFRRSPVAAVATGAS
jgi:exopolysaccharide production protein ExoZ